MHQLLASRFSLVVGEVGIVEALKAGFSLQAVDVISDIFGDETVEKNAENVTLEIPAIHRVAKVFSRSPNCFEKFLFLLCACCHIIDYYF